VSPTLDELLRREPLVNEDAVAFEKRYLEPLGVERKDVAIAWCGPSNAQALGEYLAKSKHKAIVTLGEERAYGTSHDRVVLRRFAREHDVWKNSHVEETTRKLKALRKNLDAKSLPIAPSLRPLPKAARPHDGAGIENAIEARLYKADAPKRIVYGVVLDPYQVDLQGDWIPAADIEKTAHDFVAKRGYISYQHEGLADAELVESFVEPYPTPDDEQRAMRNEPHRAFRRKYGEDVVHSGAWVMAVRLTPRLWDEYRAGKLNAFSIEGFGTRTPMTGSEMPQVTFVDVEAIG
jgi:hypothetical protein